MIERACRPPTVLALLAFAIGLAGCVLNPVTGERELALISEEQEIALGRDAADQVRTSIGLVDDSELQRYVADIGTQIAAASERPGLPWEFHVVEDSSPNAFALPGGFIFVTRGLMALLDSEAELAAVLGHEIGHVTARHSVSQLSRAQLAQIGLGLGMIVAPEAAQGLGSLANTGLSLLFLKYGRDDERQADDLAFDYMLEHDYDAREMADVFAALQAASELAGQSALPTWLASHPNPPDRIAALQARVAAYDDTSFDGATVATEPYLRRIDGLVYGEDPRRGFFSEGMFYHPELAFEFSIPADWERRNMAAAVVGASPERDAALQLTLADGDIEGASAQFLSTEGVEELGSQRTRINGRNAIVSDFRAAADGGAVQGIAAHIELAGTTYRLVAYAPVVAYSSRDTALRNIVGSFAPLTNRDALNAEPRRLDVVTLDRQMTLSEFAREYPSEIPIEELAVINQVADASTPLPKGAAAKRVTG